MAIYYNSNTINDWNFGSDNIAKVYYGVTSGSTSRLPSGYTEVEYIQRDASHNGYVGLGEYFQENTKIEIDFQMTQAKGNAIIGDYGSNDNDDWRVFLNYDVQVNNRLNYDFLTSRNYYNTGDWSKRFHIEIGNYYIKDVDSGNYLINTTKKTGFTRPNQMYLFHMDGTQSTNNIDYGYVYSVKIWQNDTLVKEFVPCFRNSDNVVGLYDIVGNEFHGSLESTLIAGSVVTPSSSTTVGNVVYQKITNGSTPPPTPPTPQPFDGKWIGYYQGGTSYSAACDSSSAITKSEVREGEYTAYTKVIIGECVYRVGEAFHQCSSMTELEIGSGVTTDLYYAFENCYALSSVTWYATSLSNQDGGFAHCTSLEKLVIYASSPPSISSTFLYDIPSNQLIIYVPDNSVSAYQSASGWGNYTIKGHSEL